jgi:hypothetical protein
MAPGPRRNFNTIYRPSCCAGLLCPHRHRGDGRRVRGSRLLDRRPPHYRCPAVPGLKTSARAILMALGPSVLPSGINCSSSGVLRTALLLVVRTAQVACGSATLRRPAPSPVLRLLWLGTPLPNIPVRAPAADAFTEVLLTPSLLGTADFTYRYCHRVNAVLRTAAPDHCEPPGPVASPVAVLQQPWLRNSATAPSCVLQLPVVLAGSSSLPGPVDLGYERNHNQTTAQCLLRLR